VRRYRTEILIPPDRFIGLQLPPDLPEGRAIVTVVVHEPDPGDVAAYDADPDRQDIEWWDEFDEEVPEPPTGRGSGSTEP
jgi:hypothetical protein